MVPSFSTYKLCDPRHVSQPLRTLKSSFINGDDASRDCGECPISQSMRCFPKEQSAVCGAGEGTLLSPHHRPSSEAALTF